MMPHQTASVLIPSLSRPEKLVKCLQSLAAQEILPTEVLVVWQGDDTATRAAAEKMRRGLPYPLRVLHSAEPGIVPAENTALHAAVGEIILLIDDDAIAPTHWIARHLAHYDDPAVGAVGGPADNFHPDGRPFPKREVEPLGKLTWYGKMIGNMYDLSQKLRSRQPQGVDHLVGYNMSLRRKAFEQFEAGLKSYWQMFEMEACLQVKARGYRVLFDFANMVEHHPTNPVYAPGRNGDLSLKVFHPAYNHAFILAKHSPRSLRVWRLLYLLLVGSVASPGGAAFVVAVNRFGSPRREAQILIRTLYHHVAGWRAGLKTRRSSDSRVHGQR